MKEQYRKYIQELKEKGYSLSYLAGCLTDIYYNDVDDKELKILFDKNFRNYIQEDDLINFYYGKNFKEIEPTENLINAINEQLVKGYSPAGIASDMEAGICDYPEDEIVLTWLSKQSSKNINKYDSLYIIAYCLKRIMKDYK